MHSPVYLDHNATSLLRTSVAQSMIDAINLHGNPSSIHSFGRRVRSYVDQARQQVANLVGATPSQIIFTSGGTEANNFALNDTRFHDMFVSSVEHPSILAAANNASLIPVNSDGIVSLDKLSELLSVAPSNSIVSVMFANNETGVIQPISDIAKIAKSKGCFVHTDAIQAAGKCTINFNALNIDCMSISAHKFGGPTGVGALIVKEDSNLKPLLAGGGQEGRQRAGTENITGIVGFGAAAEAASRGLEEFQQLAKLRSELELQIQAVGPAIFYGSGAERLVNTSLFGFPGISSETLVMAMDLEGIAVSSGSACSSGNVIDSHVLSAMGIQGNGVRVSFGWPSGKKDVTAFIGALKRLYPQFKNGLAA